MKYLLFTILLMLLITSCNHKKGTFLESITSHNRHQVSVKKLQALIKEEGLTLFETFDHQANAKAVQMQLKPETLVVFGNPKIGTILMQCNPTMGLDLPLRILVSTNYEGTTSFTYTNPEYWSLKHNIKDTNCLNILKKAKITLADLTEKASKK